MYKKEQLFWVPLLNKFLSGLDKNDQSKTTDSSLHTNSVNEMEDALLLLVYAH